MYNIKLVNKIAKVGIDVFDTDKYNVSEDAAEAVALMVRSAKLHDTVFDKETIAIARAGAGVNNIPCERCADEGIVVFNTPGANANGVKELTVSALLLAARDIVGGIAWAEELEADGQVAAKVEKGKSRFAGSELMGKTIGVIGLGAIGGLVANACVRLGMKVIGYDPHLSVTAAWNLSGSIINGFPLHYKRQCNFPLSSAKENFFTVALFCATIAPFPPYSEALTMPPIRRERREQP